ncbi:MAG: sulfatase-like hydrolase/transferase [Bacteroidales bacterium]|nr:sulfatase-like hydrolase/transferase [Bacteroidales bacterium]
MKRIFGSYKIIIIVTLLNYLLFSLVRLVFIFSTYHLNHSDIHSSLLFRALLKGLQFDGVVIGYINFIPLIIAFILNLYERKILYKTLFLYYAIIYVLSYLILFADIPYFTFFFSHITTVIFNWANTPIMMLRQILEDTYFLSFFIGFLIFAFLFVMLLKKICLCYQPLSFTISPLKNLILFLLLLVINFYIARGRITAPIKEGHSCISSNTYVNQIPLNGVFTFIKSITYKTNYYDTDYAINTTKKILNVQNAGNHIKRDIVFNDQCNKYNVIMIIMEGMTLYHTHFKNNNLTYELDTLSLNGITFTNMWSSGKHTSNGIYSILYAYPTIWSRRPTSSSIRTQYCGIPGTLKQLGYVNTFFTTHELSFDNLQEFIPQNHFDSLIGISHYKPEDIVSVYGVPDHKMFEYGIRYIHRFTQQNSQPFFVCFLTTSNHTPYVIPKNIHFVPKSKELSKQIVEYSSWAIGQFIKQCSQFEWYKNTLFVLVADHGFLVQSDNAFVPLSIHNIPLIFYNPYILKTKYISSDLCMQADVYPMLMNLLHCNYTNNTFGIDIFNQKRRFVFYSDDNILVCQNDSFQVRIHKSGSSEIVSLKSLNLPFNEIQKIKNIMTEYTLTQIQTANYLINHRQTSCTHQ